MDMLNLALFLRENPHYTPAKDPSSTSVGIEVNNAVKTAATTEYFFNKRISTFLLFMT